jgi:hypothetical protein
MTDEQNLPRLWTGEEMQKLIQTAVTDPNALSHFQHTSPVSDMLVLMDWSDTAVF